MISTLIWHLQNLVIHRKQLVNVKFCEFLTNANFQKIAKKNLLFYSILSCILQICINLTFFASKLMERIGANQTFLIIPIN